MHIYSQSPILSYYHYGRYEPYQIDPIEVAWGEKIAEPIIPTYNGLHIEGYYKGVDEDYNYIDKWDFDTDEVFEDTKLYIKSEYVPCERQDDLYFVSTIEWE